LVLIFKDCNFVLKYYIKTQINLNKSQKTKEEFHHTQEKKTKKGGAATPPPCSQTNICLIDLKSKFMKKSWFLRLQNALPLKKVICSTGLALAMLMAHSPAALASGSNSDDAPETEMRSPQDTKTVSGTVVDQNNEPIPGVSVVVDGTNKGTITDVDGNFSLSGVSENDLLVFSFVGMTTQEVPVEDQETFNITMEEETMGLEEVVVVGFGSQKKANLTGSVSSVDSESLESRPVQNVSQALQGVVDRKSVV